MKFNDHLIYIRVEPAEARSAEIVDIDSHQQ